MAMGARASGPAMAESSSAASADRAGHGAQDGERRPGVERGPGRDAARGGAKADDVAEAGGVAQRAAEVGAVGDGDHARGQGDGRAAAAAPATAGEVVGVARRAEDGVEGVRAGAELGDVALAQDDRAGGAQPLDDEVVLIRHVVGVDGRAEGRADARRRDEVLDHDGQPVQRARRPARGEGGVGGIGVGQGALGEERADRVDARIDPRDLVEVRLDDLAGGELPAADQAGEVAGGAEVEWVGDGGPPGGAGAWRRPQVRG